MLFPTEVLKLMKESDEWIYIEPVIEPEYEFMEDLINDLDNDENDFDEVTISYISGILQILRYFEDLPPLTDKSTFFRETFEEFHGQDNRMSGVAS